MIFNNEQKSYFKLILISALIFCYSNHNKKKCMISQEEKLENNFIISLYRVKSFHLYIIYSRYCVRQRNEAAKDSHHLE